jgi:hypothetical protein
MVRRGANWRQQRHVYFSSPLRSTTLQGVLTPITFLFYVVQKKFSLHLAADLLPAYDICTAFIFHTTIFVSGGRLSLAYLIIQICHFRALFILNDTTHSLGILRTVPACRTGILSWNSVPLQSLLWLNIYCTLYQYGFSTEGSCDVIRLLSLALFLRATTEVCSRGIN